MTTVTPDSDLLQISSIPELSGNRSAAFREYVIRAMGPAHRIVEIDLSTTGFVDSTGLGALVALNRFISAQGRVLRLLNPSRMCRQLLDLTRLSRIFQIEPR
jgi:anti-sigma B factor antagonist